MATKQWRLEVGLICLIFCLLCFFNHTEEIFKLLLCWIFQLDVILQPSLVLVSKSNMQKQFLLFKRDLTMILLGIYYAQKDYVDAPGLKTIFFNYNFKYILYMYYFHCTLRRLQISWIRRKSRSDARWIWKPGSLWYTVKPSQYTFSFFSLGCGQSSSWNK